MDVLGQVVANNGLIDYKPLQRRKFQAVLVTFNLSNTLLLLVMDQRFPSFPRQHAAVLDLNVTLKYFCCLF